MKGIHASICLTMAFCLFFQTCHGDAQAHSGECQKRSLYEAEKQRGRAQMQSVEEQVHFAAITHSIILNEGTPESAKKKVKKYLMDTFDLFSDMYRLLNPEYVWTRADPLRHPPLWYLGHCSSFLVNKLRVAKIINEPLNPQFEVEFAIGVDEMSWDDKLEDRDDWPSYEDTWAYRLRVRDFIVNLVDEMPMELPIRWDSHWWVILMAAEHERIHIETSSVLFRQLPMAAINVTHRDNSPIWSNVCRLGKFSSKMPDLNDLQAPKNELVDVKGRRVSYGRTIDDFDDVEGNGLPNTYGWDNEYGEQVMDVPDLKVSKYLVSNEEFWEFVVQGRAYSTRKWWTDEGWRWVSSTGTQFPKFWIPVLKTGQDVSTCHESMTIDDVVRFKYRHWLSETDLPLDWPVIVNELEGEAFTRWKSWKLNKSIRLPTEDEWFLLRTSIDELAHEDQSNWREAPGNVNLEWFVSECPIDMFEFGDKSGLYDVIGNVWTHTLTPQHPFKGFQVHPWYDDFTIPCFGSEHNLMKGGSFISTGNEASIRARYQFRRHFYQHAGLRYVESDRDLSFLTYLGDESPYTDSSVVDMYTHFHFWDERYFDVGNFPVSISEIVLKYTEEGKRGKALDLGCATGRLTFEMARYFDDVTGIDFTARLIGIGYRLKEQGFLEWKIPNHGEIFDSYRVTLADLKLDDPKLLERVAFYQNDAQNLDEKFAGFDLIVGANLIDRLANPMLFLRGIHERMNEGGVLILLSPYTWLSEYTDRDDWIGGKYGEDGQGISTPEALKEILKEWFDYVGDEDVPFVIRETSRKHQHTLSHCTIWKKR